MVRSWYAARVSLSIFSIPPLPPLCQLSYNFNSKKKNYRRIYCVYRPTVSWKLDIENLSCRKKRSDKWMLIRMLALYIPFVFTGIGMVWDMVQYNIYMFQHTNRPFQDIAYYTFIALNGVYAYLNFSLTYKLYTIREELRPKFLDETSTLLSYPVITESPTHYFYYPIYSIIALAEWAWVNSIYLFAIISGDNSSMVPCICWLPYYIQVEQGRYVRGLIVGWSYVGIDGWKSATQNLEASKAHRRSKAGALRCWHTISPGLN